MTLFSLIFSLVLILDPIGNIPIFASVLSPFSPSEQRKIIIREMLISLVILITFQFFGALLLSWIDISVPSIKVAGGVILFMIALGMIFPSIKTTGVTPEMDNEPFIVPLAVPLVAGPSILATIMAYSKQIPSSIDMLIGIVTAWGISFIILIFTPLFKKLMRDKAMTACTRLMGLVLTFISIEMLLKGIRGFFH